MESTLLLSVCTYAGHRGAVRGIDFTPGRLISGDSDGKIMLWDADAAKKARCSVASPISTFEDGGNVQVLRWCPFDEAGGSQRFASACEKLASKPAAVAVWKVTGKKADCLMRIENLPGKANDLRWAGGAKTKLLSAHDNGYVGVWSAEPAGSGANYLLKTIKLHSAPIASLCLSPDGKSLITASHDKSSKVVDISSSATETLMTFKADRPLNAVDVTTDFAVGGAGNLVVAGGRDPMVVTTSSLMEDEFEAKILDSESGAPIAAAKGHFGPVHDVVFMPWLAESGGFATCSEDGCLRVHALDGSTLHSDKVE
jgi:WD40 repeat protein